MQRTNAESQAPAAIGKVGISRMFHTQRKISGVKSRRPSLQACDSYVEDDRFKACSSALSEMPRCFSACS